MSEWKYVLGSEKDFEGTRKAENSLVLFTKTN